jgi:flagellar L-ring protein precursor FlgH
MRNQSQILLVIFAGLILTATGCASVGKKWKALISGDEATKKNSPRIETETTFNQQNNSLPASHRKYKRTTRKSIEDDARLESRAGSLWVMEGQGAYLFSENTMRMIGDPIAVRIEGDAADQLSAKSKIISKLLAQIDDRRRRAQGRSPSDEKSGDQKTDPTQPGATGTPGAGAPGAAPPGPQTAGQPEASSAGEKTEFNVKSVPTRIIERLVDGNYRVRGVQPFMIGQREYKVIVTGIIRSEDFNEQGVSATQLLDSNFDIVSSRSTEMR